MTEKKDRSYYDRKRPIYSHKKGKAIKFGEAWVDHYIKYGCDPDRKDLYMKHVATNGTIDIEDVEEGMDLSDLKIINARNAVDMFIRRYSIKEWVDAEKLRQSRCYSSLVKEDYIQILNSMVVDTSLTIPERQKAIQQVTKMLGCEGASKIETAGGFTLNMDYKKDE